MKIGLAIAIATVCGLAWMLSSLKTTVHQQEVRIQQLTASLADKSKQRAFAMQAECAQRATAFLVSRGWKPGLGDEYENHFNARLDRWCGSSPERGVGRRSGPTANNECRMTRFARRALA